MNTPSPFLTRILDSFDRGGERTAFVHRGHEVSYASTYSMLRGLHAELGAHDLRAGELVAVLGGNRPETVLAQLAAQLHGASVLLIAASASHPDRARAITDSGARLVIVDPEHEPANIADLLEQLDAIPVIWMGQSTRDGCDLPQSATRARELVKPPAVHTVFASSGTTGTPKLIAHSGIYHAMAHMFTPDEAGPQRVLLVAPMSHLTGNTTVLGSLLCGDTVVVHDGFDATAALRAITEQAISTLSLTPPRLAQLLDHPELAATDVSSVRALSLGSSPLPAHRVHTALRVFGAVVGQGYGLTEAPMVASISAAELLNRPALAESVGRIVPGMQACVVDEHGRQRGDGEAGEVWVRGLALMDGYHGQPAATAEAFVNGWLRTGDIGRFDAEGYLYLLDRATDVIISGEHGTKVYPSMLESTLGTHHLVREAAVFAAPAHGGDAELMHAVVVPLRPGALRVDDVTDYLREVLGGEHFVPETVEFVDALPLTPLGKVDKAALSAALAARN